MEMPAETLEEASEMTDSTAEFFHELDRRGHEPLLEKATGSVRFDLADGRRIDRWLVSLDRGEVTASHKNAAADCVVRTDRRLFDAIARGDVNAMAAYLRGDLTLEGDPELMVLIQRIFPGPPAPPSRRRGARRGGDQE
jgi:putative sterol carrier protein